MFGKNKKIDLPLMTQIQNTRETKSWVILPGFRSNVPGVKKEYSKPAWNLPLSRVTENGIDLDFGPLLLFDKIVVDKDSFDYATQSGYQYFRPIKESLEKLLNAGVVELASFEELLAPHNDSIVAIANHNIEAKSHLLEISSEIEKSYEGWMRRQTAYESVMGKHYDANTMRTEYGCYLHTMEQYGEIVPEKYREFEKQLFSKRKRRSPADWDLLRNLVRPTMLYTVKNYALFGELEAPFLDVGFTSELNGKVAGTIVSSLVPNDLNLRQEVEVASNVFKIAIPELRPKSIEQVLRLMDKKALHEFRKFIRKCVQDGVSYETPESGKELLLEAFKAEMELSAKRKSLSIAVTCANLFTAPIVGLPLLADLASIPVDAKMERQTRSNKKWLYALIETRD